MDPELCSLGLALIEAAKSHKMLPYDPRLPQKDGLAIVGTALLSVIFERLGIYFRYSHEHGALGTTCQICTKPFREGELCRKPVCAHLYHSACIAQAENCPQCGHSLTLRVHSDIFAPSGNGGASIPPLHSPSGAAPSDS